MTKQLLSLQLKFKKYKLNIYLLNRAALKIQHWYFNSKAFRHRCKYKPYIKPIVLVEELPKPALKSSTEKSNKRVSISESDQ